MKTTLLAAAVALSLAGCTTYERANGSTGYQFADGAATLGWLAAGALVTGLVK